MKFFTTFATTALAVVGAFAQNTNYYINTPSGITACSPILLSWRGGKAPYSLTVRYPDQPDVAPWVEFPPLTGNEVTWLVNLAPNTNCILNLRDATGATALSGRFSIGGSASTDTSCTTQSLSYSAAPAATSSSSGSSGATPTKGSISNNSTSDALALSPFHIGAGAVFGALAFSLVT